MFKTNLAVFERYFRTMIGKSIYFSMNTMICLPKLKKKLLMLHTDKLTSKSKMAYCS